MMSRNNALALLGVIRVHSLWVIKPICLVVITNGEVLRAQTRLAIDFWLHPTPAYEGTREATVIAVAERPRNLGNVRIGLIKQTAGLLIPHFLQKPGVAGARQLQPPLKCADRYAQKIGYLIGAQVTDRHQGVNGRTSSALCQQS